MKDSQELALASGLIFGILFVAGMYYHVLRPAQLQQEETQREASVVCNTDHFENNMTQYCIDHNALNTTLWEAWHKQ